MPEGMQKIVRDLRRVPAALGDGEKRRLPSEEPALNKMAKMLVAARDLEPGHVLAEGDVAARSPGDGLPPYELDELIGRRSAEPARGRGITHDALVALDEPVVRAAG